MFGSAVIDTAIGLVTIYLMLSLVCSAINEAIAARTNRRGRFLAMGLARMLGLAKVPTFTQGKHGNTRDLKGLLERFYDDRRIQALMNQNERLPSYIPAATVGAVLLDLAAGREGIPPASRLASAMSMLARDQALDAPLVAVAPGPPSGHGIAPAEFRALQALLREAIEDAERRGPRLLDEDPSVAAGRIEAALGRIFDDTMARVGGWYRRSTQKVLLLIAVCIALSINADSLVIIEHLSLDETTRTALAEVGVEEANSDGVASDQERARALIEKTRGINLPLGWTNEVSRPWLTSDSWTVSAMIASKLLGLVVTVIAIGLGAPFWFEVLQKLANLRNAGGKPLTESPDLPRGESSGTTSSSHASSAASQGSGGSSSSSTTLSVSSGSPGTAAPPTATRSGALAPDYWPALLARGQWSALDPTAQPCTVLLRMAQLSAIAYRRQEDVATAFERLGLAAPIWLDDGGSTQGFVTRWGDDLVVAYRGTEVGELNDLVTDIRCAFVPAPSWLAKADPAPRVHMGFLHALGGVRDKVTEAFATGTAETRIWFTGHSLGGALASLNFIAALGMPELARRVRLCTFGAPRVGDSTLTRLLPTDRTTIHRVTMERDPVPQVPLGSMGYRHLGEAKVYSVSGTETLGGEWRAMLDTLLDATCDLRRTGSESLRRHAIDTYIAALERARDAAGE